MLMCYFFFRIFFIKAYIVGTHLNCLDLSGMEDMIGYQIVIVTISISL